MHAHFELDRMRDRVRLVEACELGSKIKHEWVVINATKGRNSLRVHANKLEKYRK